MIELLTAEPQRFDFFQAVRVLELARPDSESVGDGVDAAREAVRFHSSLTSVFPASDIDALTRPAEADGPPRMRVNFMGLAGGFGPLPAPINDLVVERARQGDEAPRDFLDIFNHRLVSLFYRLRRKHRPALVRGTPDQGHFAAYLYALIGLGTEGLAGRLGDLPDRTLLHYAGLINQRPKSLHALERLVVGIFAVPAKGWPLQGRWLSLDRTQITRIGRSGQNQSLGTEAVLGDRVWDQQAGIRLDLGPMAFAPFLDCLPIGRTWPRLRSLVRFYAGETLDGTVRLRLAADAVPAATLSRTDGSRLGWTSWLTTRPRADEGAVTLRL